MPKNPARIRPAFLATREKLDDRFIYVGKIARESEPAVFLFYLVEILSPWHPSTKVQDVIEKTLASEFSGKDKFELPDFEDALKEVNEKLGALSQDGDNDWIGNLNAIVGLVADGGLHISICGNILGYLIRKGKISSITEGLSAEEDHPLKTFVNITSGAIAEGDRVIIGNINFFDVFSIDRLKHLTTGTSAREALFEIHKALFRQKIREASSILLDAVDEEYKPNQEETKLPEMLFLDQAPETGITKFMKKATPVAKSGLNTTKNGLSKFFHFSWQATKSAHKKWKEHYGPKTKEVLKRGASSAGAGIAKISGKMKSGSQVKYMGVKVRPYSKQPAGKGSQFFAALGSAISTIFKKENRRYLYVGLVIILVLIGYLKIRANNANREALNKEKVTAESYTQAVDMFNKAKDDLTLGKSDARTELASALDLSIKAQESASTKDEALRLQTEIEEVMDKLISATRFRDPSTLFSIKGNVLASALVGTSIYSFTDENKVYLTDTKDKSPKLVASIPSDSGKIISTAYSDSTNSLYIYTDKNSVLTLDTDSNAIGKATLDEGASFESVVATSAYVSNLYLLDAVKGTIWKHVLSNNSFSKGSAYNSSKDVSVKDAISLTIDGNIYVLKSDASAVKFTRGTSDSTFSLKTLPSPLEKIDKPTSIFTDSDTNYIYVLDKGRNRIVRFDKTGAFVNQYFLSGVTIDQFFVNPRIQKMWVTSGSNVYEFNI